MPPHGPDPPARVRVPVMRHRWESITFLHWSYDVDVVQRLVPAPLQVEPWDGRAWVGLVPFRMHLAPPAGPFLQTFPETNVRTYVVGPDGTPGVWFFSLDAASLTAVGAARATWRLPYFWADMSMEDAGAVVTYRSAGRRRRQPVGYDIRVTPGAAIDDPTEFDHYLTARFTLWTTLRGVVVATPVEHPRWPLRTAELGGLRDDLVVAAGLPAPLGAPVVHYSPGVEVRIGSPRLTRRT